jgi:hypothetical protein
METFVTILIFLTFILQFENLRNLKQVNLAWPHYIKMNFSIKQEDMGKPHIKQIWTYWKFSFFSILLLIIATFVTDDTYTKAGIFLCILVDSMFPSKTKTKRYKIKNTIETITYVTVLVFLLLHRTVLFLPQPKFL